MRYECVSKLLAGRLRNTLVSSLAVIMIGSEFGLMIADGDGRFVGLELGLCVGIRVGVTGRLVGCLDGCRDGC